jgi:hypothetical protein
MLHSLDYTESRSIPSTIKRYSAKQRVRQAGRGTFRRLEDGNPAPSLITHGRLPGATENFTAMTEMAWVTRRSPRISQGKMLPGEHTLIRRSLRLGYDEPDARKHGTYAILGTTDGCELRTTALPHATEAATQLCVPNPPHRVRMRSLRDSRRRTMPKRLTSRCRVVAPLTTKRSLLR